MLSALSLSQQLTRVLPSSIGSGCSSGYLNNSFYFSNAFHNKINFKLAAAYGFPELEADVACKSYEQQLELCGTARLVAYSENT